MELEENHHHHACKRSRVGNGSQAAAKIGHKEQHQDEDEEDGEGKSCGGSGGNNTGIMPWQHNLSSRIYRVSRASGGKDRHSKVVTAKGLRDRRVRLSVSTAIQFYDLQDRLGYDQPSKAIEWLIKAAAAAINELPSLDSILKPPHLGEEDMTIVAEPETDPSYNQQHLSTKSGCSSASETSKGSVLSLSRSESCVKAREGARERAAMDKEDREEGSHVVASSHLNLTPSLNSQTSFTELLTCGGGGSNGVAVTARANSNPSKIEKQNLTADYFSQAGLFAQPQKTRRLPLGFSSNSPFGNSSAMGMVPFNIAAAAAATTGAHPEMQPMPQFSFLQDNLMPVSAVPATGDYNLNFSISSGLAGFNRGTLQSNSPSQLPHQHSNKHLQRLSSVDGANMPFFFGSTASSVATTTNAETQYPAGFDSRLHICYWEGFRHIDVKGERKS